MDESRRWSWLAFGAGGRAPFRCWRGAAPAIRRTPSASRWLKGPLAPGRLGRSRACRGASPCFDFFPALPGPGVIIDIRIPAVQHLSQACLNLLG
mgnify:CR=1 FL=1